MEKIEDILQIISERSRLIQDDLDKINIWHDQENYALQLEIATAQISILDELYQTIKLKYNITD